MLQRRMPSKPVYAYAIGARRVGVHKGRRGPEVTGSHRMGGKSKAQRDLKQHSEES